MNPISYKTNAGELVTRADGTKEFSVMDHLGSVRATVNDADTTVLSYEYQPFGDTLNPASDETARIGFIGQERDIEPRHSSASKTLGHSIFQPFSCLLALKYLLCLWSDSTYYFSE